MPLEVYIIGLAFDTFHDCTQDWSNFNQTGTLAISGTHPVLFFSGSLFMLIDSLEFFPFLLQLLFSPLSKLISNISSSTKPSLITRVFLLSFSLYFYSSIYCIICMALIIWFAVRYLCFNYNCVFSLIIKFIGQSTITLLYPKPSTVLCG